MMECPYHQHYQRESAYHDPRHDVGLSLVLDDDHNLVFHLSPFLVTLLDLQTNIFNMSQIEKHFQVHIQEGTTTIENQSCGR